jgi:hypothetical protein
MQDTQHVYCSPLSIAEPRNLSLILMKVRTTLESLYASRPWTRGVTVIPRSGILSIDQAGAKVARAFIRLTCLGVLQLGDPGMRVEIRVTAFRD